MSRFCAGRWIAISTASGIPWGPDRNKKEGCYGSFSCFQLSYRKRRAYGLSEDPCGKCCAQTGSTASAGCAARGTTSGRRRSASSSARSAAPAAAAGTAADLRPSSSAAAAPPGNISGSDTCADADCGSVLRNPAAGLQWPRPGTDADTHTESDGSDTSRIAADREHPGQSAAADFDGAGLSTAARGPASQRSGARTESARSAKRKRRIPNVSAAPACGSRTSAAVSAAATAGAADTAAATPAAADAAAANGNENSGSGTASVAA